MLFIANNSNKIMRPKPIVPSLKFPVPRIVEPKPEKIPVTQPQTIVPRLPPEGPLRIYLADLPNTLILLAI